MTPSDLRTLMATAERQPGETTEQYNARARAEHQLSSWRVWLPELLDEADPLIDGLRKRIDSVVEFNGSGFWVTCSGCHESEDGYPNGHYPHSPVLQCTLGAGCHECGGLGAVWDGVDYEDMAMVMLAEDRDPIGTASTRCAELEAELEEARAELALLLPIAPASQAGTRAPAAIRHPPAGAHSSEVSQ